MLKRKVLDQLNIWKNKANKKSLIITGARQVGKTFAVREFAKEYPYFAELNFLENPGYTRLFSDALSVEQLIKNIEVEIPGARFEEGRTLLFLDEIQECGEALQSLKFWALDGRYDVIATGSALGMNFKQNVSFPVGYVEYIDMYALDFEEFLWARGITERSIEDLKESFRLYAPVSGAIHSKMVSLLKEYMVTGGMPEVVTAFCEGGIREADEVQRRIYRDYLNDIAHYAPADIRIKARDCYRSVPVQLTQENHKFQYSVVEKKATASKFTTSIEWLMSSYIVKKICNIKRFDYPLKAFSDESNFRLYMTDIGLLVSTFDFSLKKAILADEEMENPAVNIVLGLAKGGLYESLVADMLIKGGHKDIYFYKDPKNTSEIEFVLEGEEGILPIEVKAGRKKANSLNKILESDRIKLGWKLSLQNAGVSGKRVTLPIYMLMFL